MSTLSDLEGGRGLAVWLLKVQFPGGNTLLLSSAPYTSATLGNFVAKVLDWGGLDYKVSDREGRLDTVMTRVVVADTDRTIKKLYEGVYADQLRGSVATQYLVTPTNATPLTVFEGIIVRISFPKDGQAELTMKTNDDQLKRDTPRGGWKLTRKNWPNADPTVYDSFARLAYGYHDASGIRALVGMLPTLYVDKLQYRYLVCAGKAKTLLRVYKDGVIQSAALYGSAFEYVTVDGRIYSCIKFSADQGTAVITCDAEGYEAVGDGSGAVITNPATEWAHRLTNFVLGDYKTGAWLSTNALIDSPTLAAAEAHLTLKGAKGSDYGEDEISGLEIIAKFCASWRYRSFWTLSGKIGIGYENFCALPYTGRRWRWWRDEVGEFAYVEDDVQRITRLVVKTTYSAADAKFLTSFEVVDASPAAPVQGQIDLEMSESK